MGLWGWLCLGFRLFVGLLAGYTSCHKLTRLGFCGFVFFSLCSSEKPLVHYIFLGIGWLVGFLCLFVFWVVCWLCLLRQVAGHGAVFGGCWSRDTPRRCGCLAGDTKRL